MRQARLASLRLRVQKLLHVPGAGRAAFGAEAAVQAHVLVLRHDAPGFESVCDVEILIEVQ